MNKKQFPIVPIIILLASCFIGTLLTPIPSFCQKTDKVKKEIFQEVDQLINKAKAEDVPFLAPSNFSRGMEFYRKALAKYKKGAKLKNIQKDLDQAKDYFMRSFSTAKISRPALEELMKLRKFVRDKKFSSMAPKQFSEAELQLQNTIKDVERGDLRSVRKKIMRTKFLYQETVLDAYKDVILKDAQKQLELGKSTIPKSQFQRSKNALKGIEVWIKSQKNKVLDITDFIQKADVRIQAAIEIRFPEFYRNLPQNLELADFTLKVISYENKGRYDSRNKAAVGLSGLAEIRFNCGLQFLVPVLPGEFQLLNQSFVVVNTVSQPERELSLAEARRINPQVRLGEELVLPLQVKAIEKASILEARRNLLDMLRPGVKPGGIRVRFEDCTIKPTSQADVGKIIEGRAFYPTEPPIPAVPAKIHVAGFTIYLDALVITPSGAEADVMLEFPKSIVAGEGCGPAALDLGKVSITADCQLYKEMPGEVFGPFIIDKTGMVIQGKGFIVDLSTTHSPGGMDLIVNWRGVILSDGETIPAASSSMVSNTGYLSGPYSFTNAQVTASGLKARFSLAGSYTFSTLLPYGYDIWLSSGYVDVEKSAVKGGAFSSGTINLPTKAVCGGTPGSKIRASFTNLIVQDDMDLAGTAIIAKKIYWGELSQPGKEVITFAATASPDAVYLYLPGEPSDLYGRYVPKTDIDFSSVSWYGNTLAKLEAQQVTGVTIIGIIDFDIFTPDIQGTPKVISYSQGSGAGFSQSWLNIELGGVNGQVNILSGPRREKLGDPSTGYYKGNMPFDALLECVGKKKGRCFFVQFSSSSIYDSEFHGSLKLEGPSQADIPFRDLELTSTANMVGGDIDLSGGPVTLKYWGVELAEASPGNPAGGLSIKTGQIILTQSGIKEPRHFTKLFKLVWGEMLADGNLGELFFDYNSGGQRFDGFSFTHHYIALSKYDSSVPGYLQVCGDNHFNFFGSKYLSIQDHKYTGSDPLGVYGGRRIEIMKQAVKDCGPSNLKLEKEWGGRISAFAFEIQYDDNDQDGFIGEGTVSLPEHFQSILAASIQIDSQHMAIGMFASTGNNFFLSGMDIGRAAELWGCITIDGNTLSCIIVGFTLESTAQTDFGILGGAGAMIEAKLVVKPTVTTFSAAGLMYLDLSLGGNVTIEGSILLITDRGASSIFGDFQGDFEFSSLVAGLKANGHVNWFLSPTTQYFQGRAGISVFGLGLGSSGAAGGIFIGNNVPRGDVWVLTDPGNRFRVNNISSLPAHITGVYGFGFVDFSQDFGVFGGGIEIYAGVGAFLNFEGLGEEIGGMPLPYILAKIGVSLHGEILWGVVSASAWVALEICVGDPFYFEGTAGLKGCVLWVFCASVDITVRLDESGFEIF